MSEIVLHPQTVSSTDVRVRCSPIGFDDDNTVKSAMYTPQRLREELADGPILYARCQGQKSCFISSANSLSLLLYKVTCSEPCD